MFEFLKDYDAFRTQIRDVKVETFTALKELLDSNEALKREMADLKAGQAREASALAAKHEREIMTLAHSLQLERERFALEREQLIAKGDLFGERERVLEKNFIDLRETLTSQHQATKEILSLVVTRLPEVRVRMEGGLVHDTDSHRALPAGVGEVPEPPAE